MRYTNMHSIAARHLDSDSDVTKFFLLFKHVERVANHTGLLGLTYSSYVQVTSSTLSLPLSTGTTVLTIILPLLAAANVFYTPYLSSFLRQKLTSSSALQQLLPVALQVLQGILTVVLATLSAEGFIPGQLLDCSLHGNWQRMYREHDGRSIERIQDSFTCCGLRTVKDMDWPRLQCSALYGDRHDACIGPWRAAMQRSAGLEFAVAVTVGILQVSFRYHELQYHILRLHLSLIILLVDPTLLLWVAQLWR